jgi:hypothetical protein
MHARQTDTLLLEPYFQPKEAFLSYIVNSIFQTLTLMVKPVLFWGWWNFVFICKRLEQYHGYQYICFFIHASSIMKGRMIVIRKYFHVVLISCLLTLLSPSFLYLYTYHYPKIWIKYFVKDESLKRITWPWIHFLKVLVIERNSAADRLCVVLCTDLVLFSILFTLKWLDFYLCLGQEWGQAVKIPLQWMS